MVSKGSSVTLISTKMFSNNEKPFVIPKQVFFCLCTMNEFLFFFLSVIGTVPIQYLLTRFPKYVVPSSSSLSLPSTDIVSSGYPMLINS